MSMSLNLTWREDPNPEPHPGLNGADAWMVYPEELPEATAYGPDRETAKAEAVAIAEACLAKMSPKERERLFVRMDQLAIKIPAAKKAAIVERARAANMTITAFVLSRCLGEPVTDPAELARLSQGLDRVLERVRALEEQRKSPRDTSPIDIK